MSGSFERNSIKAKTKFSGHTVLKRLLIPSACVLILLITSFCIVLVYTQKKALEQSSQQRLKNAAKILSQTIEAQSSALTALEEIILQNSDLPEDLQRRNRPALFSNYNDIFAGLQKNYGITHFYFHLPDRVNLLRLHKKEKYGDTIDRFTLFESIRTQKPSSGLELGPLGTLTLRVVQPIFLNDLPVGYLELGKEIEDILGSIHKEPGIEIALTISKYRLDQSQWETGMAMLGRQAKWNRFVEEALIYTSLPQFPVQWEYFITDKGGHGQHNISTITEYNDKSWHLLALDITDASGTAIGDILIFIDISEGLIQYQLFTALIAVTAFIILAMFLFLIFRVLQNTDKVIFKQQQSIEKSENRFRGLFNSITDLIYTMDLDGNFTSANPAMHKLFGYDMDEFIGRRATEFMSPKFLNDFNTRYLEVVKKQGFCEGISYYYRKDNQKIYIEYKSSLVEPVAGKPYISGMGRDVTEKILSEQTVKELQEQIIQSQKMESIGTLAGGIAHDFNNILFPVMGHTEILLNEFPKESHTHKSLNKIYSGALRARDLVRQILDFSRQEKGETRLMKIHPVIKEVLKLMYSSISSNITIVQDISKECNPIKGDPTKIHQIIMNLITNACYAMDETGGQLTINLKETELGPSDLINPDMHQGTHAELTISDTGKGMDSELISKIFVPFFTTKEKGKGTGMGLSVVHGIVIGMGGGIKVDSEIGKGTSIHVYLPVMRSEPEEPIVDHDSTVLTGGSEHILLVDDEEAIALMEKEILESLGYQVTTRTSSIEALEVFRAVPDRFDMVITDMAMPNMTGDKLSKQLIQIRPDIPILLCTGFSDIMHRQQVASIGIKDFLLKPVKNIDLAHKIRKVLDDRR